MARSRAFAMLTLHVSWLWAKRLKFIPFALTAYGIWSYLAFPERYAGNKTFAVTFAVATLAIIACFVTIGLFVVLHALARSASLRAQLGEPTFRAADAAIRISGRG